MRHYITTMSQTLTKPTWPEATTCVTTAAWTYHSTVPSPLLYIGMTKKQYSGCAHNHKLSGARQIMAIHLLTTVLPLSTTYFHCCFCHQAMIKCTLIYVVSLCLDNVSILTLLHSHLHSSLHLSLLSSEL